MVRRRINRQQFLEVVIVIGIVFIILYRLALVYDFVPDAYQPSTILSNIYDVIKKGIVAESTEDNTMGHAAKWTADQLDGIEKDLHDRKIRYIREEEAAERCKENLIFRYFMFMGDEDNPNCSESNMQLKEATKEVFNEASKNPKKPTPAEETTPPEPAATPSAPAVTPAPAAPAMPPTYVPPPQQPPAVPAPLPVEPANVTAPPPQGPGPGGGRQPVSVSEPVSVPAGN